MRWFIAKRHLVALIGVLIATILIMLMSGCTTTNERSQSSSKRTQVEEMHQTPDGGFLKKTTEYIDGEKASEVTTKADVEWAGAISKGVGQAASGDWAGLAVTGVTALMAGGAAVIKHRESAANKRDADEAWDKLLAKHEKADA